MRGSEASGPGALSDAPSTLATSIQGNPTAALASPLTDPKLVASNIEHVLQAMSHDNGGLVSVSGNSSGSTGKGILIGVLSAFGSAAVAVLVLAIFFFFKYTQRGRIILDRIGRPGEFDDEQAFAREEAEALEVMDDLTRSEYLRAKGKASLFSFVVPFLSFPFEAINDDPKPYSIMDVRLSLTQYAAFIEANPPESMQTDISLSQFLAIQEKGVSAWEFQPELEIANCFVEGRTEIEFYDSECSVQTNLPVPKQNDVYYWEAKIYDKPDNTLISIGMTTKPYPLFKLPGAFVGVGSMLSCIAC